MRSQRWQLTISVLAIVAGAAILVPWSWWRQGARLATAPGWRWLPVVLMAVGLAGVARRRRAGNATGRRPSTVRAPLFVHVVGLLLVAVTAAALVGIGLWVLLGRPPLVAAGTGRAPGAAAAWSVQNTLNAMKIVLSVVAGIGGVVALTVAYRKQGHSEAAEHREDTKLFTERFGKAADELGSDKAAVRLAGVYAMAGLADDWKEGRQRCISVLCAYLRMPYTPPEKDPPPLAVTAPVGLPLSTAKSADNGEARQEQQVRHTVLEVIREHLLPVNADQRSRWHGRRFDIRGATIAGGNLTGIDVADDTLIDFEGAMFSGGAVNFGNSSFSGGTVNFGSATFSGGTVNFGNSRFSGGTVNFGSATFSGGTVNFRNSNFSGSTVNFRDSTFSGSTVNFGDSRFSGGTVNFGSATFSGSTVNFWSSRFSGGTVNFGDSRFSGGTVDFWSARFTGGAVDFWYARFSGGAVDLSRPASWKIPPQGVSGSEPGARWPTSEHLAVIKTT
ncbi:pentapeptide repeat-containing protein [Actinoplanes sp. NBRC 103695]|uniref:pentapeptide repeat-containing protein n=1 Tax=Actinoplanes sp. NBRC 103695 TaxID=3032202 RepID=UPI0025534C70|nr:pentapeptide repeat-containing protein [Actinoplanes sp. NBRC 103695]